MENNEKYDGDNPSKTREFQQQKYGIQCKQLMIEANTNINENANSS